MISTLAAVLLGTSFLACLWLALSYLFIHPNPKILIKKSDTLPEYGVTISNLSSRDIYNLEFSFKFDEKYPVKRIFLQELNFKTDVILRSIEDFDLKEYIEGEMVSQKRPITLMNGFRGAIKELCSGATIAIEVTIDRKYNGSMGDVFPPMLEPSLRSNNYYVEYKFKPLGFLESFYITKKGCYDFNGKKTKSDNYKTYEQKIVLPDGKELLAGFEIRKKQKIKKYKV